MKKETSIHFVTGSKGKYEEIKSVIPQIEMLDLGFDLIEVQNSDPIEILRCKLREVLKHVNEQGGCFGADHEIIVEDTSL